MLRQISYAALLLLVACQPETSGHPDRLIIEDAWVRAAPPKATMLAGYLQIDNKTPVDAVLTAVESPQFESVTLHTTQINKGIARMRHLNSITVAAGARFHFRPGAEHLMLMNPLRAMTPGDRVELILHFADGSMIDAVAMVRHD